MAVGLTISTLLVSSLALLYLLSRQKKQLIKIDAQTGEINHQQDLLERNLAYQEVERQRIASQLHDDICSKLGVLHLTFHRLQRTNPGNGDYDEMCAEINEL